MVAMLLMTAKLAALGLLKIKDIINKGCDIITSVHDAIVKNLSSYSNYAVNVVMWPKFGYSSISIMLS